MSRGSDCADQLPSLPRPAGQFGVWELSLNSQNDVVVCGACCSWNLCFCFFFFSFFSQNLACVRPDEQHPCIDGLSLIFQLFASPPPPPPRVWPPHAFAHFSIAGASEGYHAKLLCSPLLSPTRWLCGAQKYKAEGRSRGTDKLIDCI